VKAKKRITRELQIKFPTTLQKLSERLAIIGYSSYSRDCLGATFVAWKAGNKLAIRTTSIAPAILTIGN
jgi:hypothetical protein